MNRIEHTEILRGLEFQAEVDEAEAAHQASGTDMTASPGRGMEVAFPGGLARGAVQAQAEHGGPEAGE
jgi:hypothetical protein